MPQSRVVGVIAWIALAILEQVLVGFAIIASVGALCLLVTAIIWGRRLYRAAQEFEDRVTQLEISVYGYEHGDESEG